MNNARTETTRTWFLVIFGAFFALPALYMLITMLGGSLYDATRMQFWEQAEAKLLSSEVKHYSGDSSTFKVIADYTYQVNGRTYEGDRVSVHSGSDNVGDYHHEMGRKLRRSDNSVTIYYNPDNPQEAIIDRSLRWEMLAFTAIFVTIFGLVGGGIMYLGWKGDTRIISSETDEKPWLANPKWADNKIDSNAKLEMYGLIIFSLIWNLMIWPVLLFKGKEIYEEVPTLILPILALFPVVGLYLIHLMTKAIRQHRSFGKTPLTLTPFPGSIGGQIGGKIALSNNTSSLVSYAVKVVCVRKSHSGSGDNRSVREHLFWEGDTFAKYFSYGMGSGLEFCINVPEGLPETDLDKDDRWHEWRVEVESPDIKLKRTFEIPVYQTEQQSTVKYKVPQQLLARKTEVDLNSSLPVQEHANEVHIHYPMFYKPTTKIVLAVIGVVMLAMINVFRSEMPTFLFWLFCFIGSLMAFFSLKSLLSSLTVILKNRTLDVSKGLFGVFKHSQKIAFSEVVSIDKKEIMRSQSGNKHTVHYSVLALLRSGKTLELAKQIEGDSAAKAVEAYFRDKLGLTDLMANTKQSPKTKVSHSKMARPVT